MRKIPKIGRRNVKTAIAVLLALLVKVLLMLCIDLPTGTSLSKIIYTPFFGGIAAAYSMHMDKEGSLKQAKIRTMGSIYGGIFGMVVLIILEAVLIHWLHLDSFNSVLYYLVDFALVAGAMIFLIHITVVTHATYATWIACLTYLSVTVSIRNDFDEQLAGVFFQNSEILNSYVIAMVFAANRILSTVIGVGISLGVNLFALPKPKNKNILFVSSLDNAILNSQNQITGFTKYKIEQLRKSGCKITFATTRTQSTLNGIFNGIALDLPLITMNGAAIYHPKEKHYISVDHIPQAVRRRLENLFIELNVNSFCCVVDDDILQVYHESVASEAEAKYYQDRKNTFFDNYVRGVVPDDMEACFYVLIQPMDMVQEIIERLTEEGYAEKLDIIYYPYDVEGYYLLKISSITSNKATRLLELKEQTHAEKVVVFGSGTSDMDMMRVADVSLCLKTAPQSVKDAATKVLESSDPDTILKTVDKIYHVKDFEEYQNTLLENKRYRL